jgi:hypothetical protein
MRDNMKFSIIGQDSFWWEDDTLTNGIESNPRYISSMGENYASVSGECGSVTPVKVCAVKVKDPCGSLSGNCNPIALPKPVATPATFDRWVLNVR